MSIEITPKLLADLRQNAEAATPGDPAVVLALVAEVERLNKRFDEQKLLATRMIEHAAEQKIEIDRLNDKLDELICSGCNQQPKFCVCELLPLSGSDQRG